MKTQPYVTLNNGIEMPLVGLGVFDMHNKEAEQAMEWALETGYRLIDTAAMYQNELQIGNAIRHSSVAREEIFLTTKVDNADQGYTSTLRAFDHSLELLQTDYVDLYLVHWPIKQKRKDTWKALEKIYESGKARAIGVANYLEPFLEELEAYADIVPAVNQVEFSPFLNLENLLKRCQQKGTVLQAYTPLVRGLKMNDERLVKLSKKYGKTPAQIILRWNIQKGVSPIPKSSNLLRIKENFDIFDFEISEEDMKLMNTFNENFRVVDDPMDFL
ncbi:aldo/keto reductase [Lacihabitans sp. LS3-19]|uniref:aldo/keto reductase n=1 Tax=Lacihabitans sp. LS3-19 TaxID=2487335 RepID=UPI0020CEE52C|nr:aldo/keto reductase [Lacihabitans sp. LS3-19]MCP9766485.1 aldo/keto reductase [Lacihabitans sp. LS3-19]